MHPPEQLNPKECHPLFDVCIISSANLGMMQDVLLLVPTRS